MKERAMLTVHIVSPTQADANKVTIPLVYQPEEGSNGRLVTVPMGVNGVTDSLFPCRVAYKRSSSEVKNGRRRILVEDTVPVYTEADELSSTPVEASRRDIKIHTVIELPWTTPVEPGTTMTKVMRLAGLRSALQLHAMSLLPGLVTTGAANVEATGVAVNITGTESEFANSPIVRGSFGMAPFGDGQVLGSEDTTVE